MPITSAAETLFAGAAERWADQAFRAGLAMLETRQQLGAGRFRYIDLDEATPLYWAPIGFNGWLCVIGHPDHGSYEWVARHESPGCKADSRPRYEHSDCGYGNSVAALRDGLNRMEPEL